MADTVSPLIVGRSGGGREYRGWRGGSGRVRRREEDRFERGDHSFGVAHNSILPHPLSPRIISMTNTDVDLWIGPDSATIPSSSLYNCENAITKNSGQIIINPDPNLPVTTTKIFSNGVCRH